jgi:hypothetical protein
LSESCCDRRTPASRSGGPTADLPPQPRTRGTPPPRLSPYDSLLLGPIPKRSTGLPGREEERCLRVHNAAAPSSRWLRPGEAAPPHAAPRRARSSTSRPTRGVSFVASLRVPARCPGRTVMRLFWVFPFYICYKSNRILLVVSEMIFRWLHHSGGRRFTKMGIHTFLICI